MSFQLRDHTADVAVEATASTPGDLFAAIADGLTAAMCESYPNTGGERFQISLEAESLEGLLYDYLDQLIYERDVRGVLPVENDATVEPVTDADRTEEAAWSIVASARGIALSEVTARDVKAVTYSEMRIEERPDGWYGYVVFDV